MVRIKSMGQGSKLTTKAARSDMLDFEEVGEEIGDGQMFDVVFIPFFRLPQIIPWKWGTDSRPSCRREQHDCSAHM